LVNELALSSILKDEFHLDARKITERNAILLQFKDDLQEFNSLAKNVCLPLFVKHNVEGKARFYNRITDLISVEFANVRMKDSADDLIPVFEGLPFVRCIRGKYHYEFIKKWLVSLREKINSDNLLNIPRVNKDPAQMEMRRFASATRPPNELISSICLKNRET
jgi:hypothetical protein